MARKVLYVDDETALCEIFSESFATDGIEIHAFANAREAIEACNKNHYDVMFIDFRMPEMNGDDVAKATPKTVPKYLLTGEVDPKTTYPFKGVLPKPFDHQKMETIIRSLIA